MSESDLHLALRIAPWAKVGKLKVDVVEAHNERVEACGRAALGKFGAPPKTAAHRLDQQIQDGRGADLYLVYRSGTKVCGFRAPLCWVGLSALPDTYGTAIPSYYAELLEEPSAWFVIDAPLQPTELADLHLASNGRPLLDVISECRTAAMMVKR